MKIVSIERRVIYYLETDECECHSYLCHGADNWDVRMGESYESFYDSEEIEEKFQEYIKSM